MKVKEMKFWLTVLRYVATFVAGILSGNSELINMS